MTSRLLSSITALTLIASLGAAADAASCHGANGKFVKCPKPAAMTSMSKTTKDAKGRCHAANGKFAKCPK